MLMRWSGTRTSRRKQPTSKGADLSPPFPAIGITDLREPARNAQGSVIAYTKPMMLLTDDVSISGADAFAAMFQENRRGINCGVRTNGGGGNAEQFPAGWYSEAFAGSEINLAVRNHVLNVPGYPPHPVHRQRRRTTRHFRRSDDEGQSAEPGK